MKKPALILLILVLLALLLFWLFRSGCHTSKKVEAIRFDPDTTTTAYPRFVKDEIIIFFKRPPSPPVIAGIRQELQGYGIDSVHIIRCNDCGGLMELWQAPGIHNTIHAEGVKAGSGGPTKPVGEDTAAFYALNYYQYIPQEPMPPLLSSTFPPPSTVTGVNKDTIVVAVLDTGIDTVNFTQRGFVRTNPLELPDGADNDGNCYPDDIHGWNFAGNNADISDDNPSRHGSLVSQYIINEFAASTQNYLRLLVLKTHDSAGTGTLFGTICALYYAIARQAQIINASWGFYYYQDNPIPFLDSLITRVLPANGILFVTAAGNRIDADDALAKAKYLEVHNTPFPDSLLRHLEYHNFYPACLSEPDNNVITVTTTDGSIVSPTQNHAARFTDLAIRADSVSAASMRFGMPFPNVAPAPISGSSFATAIATGKIGARCSRNIFAPNLTKGVVFGQLSGVIQTSGQLADRGLVREGRTAARGD